MIRWFYELDFWREFFFLIEDFRLYYSISVNLLDYIFDMEVIVKLRW